MKTSILFAFVVVLAMLVGCGGNNEENNEPAAAVEKPKPASTQKTERKTRSVLDKIDDALDEGNYMAAVDIALRQSKTPADRRENVQYVSDAIAGAMAQGDAKAHQAYKKLNAFWMRQQGR